MMEMNCSIHELPVVLIFMKDSEESPLSLLGMVYYSRKSYWVLNVIE